MNDEVREALVDYRNTIREIQMKLYDGSLTFYELEKIIRITLEKHDNIYVCDACGGTVYKV